MSALKSFQHPLALLVLAIIIPTSWTVNMKPSEELLRDIFLQNETNFNDPSGPVPVLSSRFSQNSKQFDERLSNIIANAVLHFGHNVGLQLAAQDPYAANTEMFSPLSVMAALSLLMLGAKGTSYQELKQLNGLDSDIEFRNNPSKFHVELGLLLSDLQHLNGGMNKRQNALWRNTHVKSSPSRSTNRQQGAVDHIINVANGLFVQSGYELNSDYKQIMQSIYDSQLTQLDFQAQSSAARDYINSWVDRSTHGKIPQIISGQIEKSTNVILASVLYFKGFWANPFFPRSTKEENFYPDGIKNPPIKVQMMPTGGVFPFYDAKEYDCRIIGLPYKGNETTMYVIQPNNSSRQKLRELQQVLSGHKINQMIDRMERKTTVMIFPKMHFTKSMTMKTILQSMDIRSIFESSYSDLSLIGARPSTTNNVAAQATAQSAPSSTVVPFSSIYRNPPTQPKLSKMDLHEGLIFTSRIDAEDPSTTNDTSSTNSENAAIQTTAFPYTGKSQTESQTRVTRQVFKLARDPTTEALANIEADRLKTDQYRSDLYVDDIIHKVDFAVDEYGTEAAAATLTYLTRSGTDVVFRGDTPFLIVIRHDPTKLPLFYGIINKPEL